MIKLQFHLQQDCLRKGPTTKPYVAIQRSGRCIARFTRLTIDRNSTSTDSQITAPVLPCQQPAVTRTGLSIRQNVLLGLGSKLWLSLRHHPVRVVHQEGSIVVALVPVVLQGLVLIQDPDLSLPHGANRTNDAATPLLRPENRSFVDCVLAATSPAQLRSG